MVENINQSSFLMVVEHLCTTKHRGGESSFTFAPMLYITYIVGVQDQLFGKSLDSIENSIHFQLQMHKYPFINT